MRTGEDEPPTAMAYMSSIIAVVQGVEIVVPLFSTNLNVLRTGTWDLNGGITIAPAIAGIVGVSDGAL